MEALTQPKYSKVKIVAQRVAEMVAYLSLKTANFNSNGIRNFLSSFKARLERSAQ